MRSLNLLGVLAGILVVGLCWTVSAQAQWGQERAPRGSYRQSCNDEHLRGDTLIAVCRRAEGRMERTSLDRVNRCVGDIANINGQLRCEYGHGGGGGRHGAAPPAGSYQRSCDDIRMDGTTLIASCRRPSGREQRTSLPNVNRCIGDIGNIDGQLRCNYGR